MKFLNTKGMSIVQVMVAAGLMGALAIGLMKLSQKNMKSSKAYETKNDITAIIGEIRGMLSSPDACKESFVPGGTASIDATNSGDTVTSIKNSSGNAKFQEGTRYGSVILNNILITDQQDSDVTVNSNDVGETYLKVTFDRGSQTFGNRMLTRNIKLWVKVNPSNLITECRAFSSGESNIWTRSSADITKIFYNDGNVGIGTDNPEARLHVVNDGNGPELRIDAADATTFSGLQMSNGGTDRWVLGSSNSPGHNFQLLHYKNSGAQEQSFFINRSTGRVGIGPSYSPTAKLDVQGEIKIGIATAPGAGACSPNGKMRYNAGTGMQVCHGGTWQTIALGTTGISSCRICYIETDDSTGMLDIMRCSNYSNANTLQAAPNYTVGHTVRNLYIQCQ
jgi:Tfp pilus assembly protein PilV